MQSIIANEIFIVEIFLRFVSKVQLKMREENNTQHVQKLSEMHLLCSLKCTPSFIIDLQLPKLNALPTMTGLQI